MDDLLKKAMEGMDNEGIVPKHTKRTSEETTTFVRLDKDKDKSTKKAKLDEGVEEVSGAVAKEGKGVKEGEKEGHPEPVKLDDRDDRGGGDEEEFYEPCHEPYGNYRPTYGCRRYAPYNRHRPYRNGFRHNNRYNGGRSHGCRGCGDGRYGRSYDFGRDGDGRYRGSRG